MTISNATDSVADNQNSLQQTQQNNSQNNTIQHSHNHSAVISAEFFRNAPTELIEMIANYLPSFSDLYGLSRCTKPLYRTLATSNGGDWAKRAQEELPQVLTMIPNRGFRPFNNQQLESLKLVHFHKTFLDQATVNNLLQQTEKGMLRAAAALQLHAGGASGKFAYALANINRWPEPLTKLFGHDDFNLKHVAWQALATELARNDRIDAGYKAGLFDQILGTDPQTEYSASTMLNKLSPLGSLSTAREKLESLGSFCEENSKRTPFFSFIGLLSLVPVMESRGPGHRPGYEFSSKYVFDEMHVQARTLGPKYEASLLTMIGAHRTLKALCEPG